MSVFHSAPCRFSRLNSRDGTSVTSSGTTEHSVNQIAFSNSNSRAVDPIGKGRSAEGLTLLAVRPKHIIIQINYWRVFGAPVDSNNTFTRIRVGTPAIAMSIGADGHLGAF